VNNSNNYNDQNGNPYAQQGQQHQNH